MTMTNDSNQGVSASDETGHSMIDMINESTTIYNADDKLREDIIFEMDNFEAYRDNSQWSDEQLKTSIKTLMNNIREACDRLEAEIAKG